MAKPHIVPRCFKGMRKWYCYDSRPMARQAIRNDSQLRVGSGYTPSDAFKRYVNALENRKIHFL